MSAGLDRAFREAGGHVIAALTLGLIYGLPVEEIARAFLVPEPTLAQRLVRANAAVLALGPAPAERLWLERRLALLG